MDLNIGDRIDYADFPEVFGDELTFEELFAEPSSSMLLIWRGAFRGAEITDVRQAVVGRVERIVDEEDGPEYASIMLDVGERSPLDMEIEDMTEPDDIKDGEEKRTWNMYDRVWRVRRDAEAAPVESETVQAAPTGAAPEAGETALVEAAPAEVDALTLAQTLHQRIVKDAQLAAETLWDMCSAIKEMRDGKHYKALLYANFEGYCEEALGMSRAQAYRYITIAEGMTPESVASMQQIGMTKLALLASVTEEQREAIAATVDVESTTVRELKAQIEALRHQADGAEKSRQDAEARAQKWYDEAQQKAEDLNAAKTKLKSAETAIEGKQHIIDAKEARAEHYRAKEASLKADIAQLQDRITELESRPVEVAVQTDDAALEQLRAEHRAEVAELEAEIDRTEARADGYGECKALMTVAKDTLHRIALYFLKNPGCPLKYEIKKMMGDAMKEIDCCIEEAKS